jgi:hypothetical protein
MTCFNDMFFNQYLFQLFNRFNPLYFFLSDKTLASCIVYGYSLLKKNI